MIITTTDSLAAACNEWQHSRYITIDTEFIRERTYFPQLCLIQVAGDTSAAAIDPLATTDERSAEAGASGKNLISLDPLLELLRNKNVPKIFHAARQDLEIFYNLMGELPAPIYDTQIAAMVCGFGESVGYETLVRTLLNKQLDKNSRYTDWAKRPLTDRQLDYAMGDVIYLREIYELLSDRLTQAGRTAWIEEEMAELANPTIYKPDPMNCWQRLKYRNRTPAYLNILRAIAAWREETAMQKDVPRQRIIKDDVLLMLAAGAPETLEDMHQQRLRPHEVSNALLPSLIARIAEAKHAPKETFPQPEALSPRLTPDQEVLMDLLRVLLKRACEKHHVASKLVADKDDLEALVSGRLPAEHHLTHGWRHEVFGHVAQQFLRGDLAMKVGKNGGLEIA